MSTKEKEEMTRRASVALRILEPAIPEGSRGVFYRTETGWVVDYGRDAVVDLPHLSKEDVFTLINIDMGLPFAKYGDGPEHSNDRELCTRLPAEKEGIKIQQNTVLHAVWRKCRNGDWMLYGPAWILRSRSGPVQVRRSDGTIEHRHVWWTSKPFDVDGVQYCFGKAEEKRLCLDCGGYHLRAKVGELFGKGIGARWCAGQETCSCGGALA